MTTAYKMNPIYAARIERNKAESTWMAVDRNPNSTVEQRAAAREAYELANASYRAAVKLERADA